MKSNENQWAAMDLFFEKIMKTKNQWNSMKLNAYIYISQGLPGGDPSRPTKDFQEVILRAPPLPNFHGFFKLTRQARVVRIFCFLFTSGPLSDQWPGAFQALARWSGRGPFNNAGQRKSHLARQSVLFFSLRTGLGLSLIHIWRCRRSYLCRSRWSPYH